ncbi:MAG: hypothetical protein F6J97_13670 [Leptolyngbya sp. SIO4C1]|nr:hypothetical protein [Leptolyngbya sp. SIO4C1]
MFLFVSMSSILLIAYLGYSSGRSALRQTIENSLTSIRSARAYQIESYFANTHAQTRTLSQDLMVVEAMRAFRAAAPALTSQNLPPTQLAELRRYYQEIFIPQLAANQRAGPAAAIALSSAG